ncbi:uncharacterized protein LOC125488663 [Plutella xylostella]|uniref:uncharacterized protein LOC125488663 n=1 Tax=Plutella xylostella TaxID=51655 RepID=UPI002032BDB3|nr:uncharacterized protein LOC125488663 [Plutella xylostella]
MIFSVIQISGQYMQNLVNGFGFPETEARKRPPLKKVHINSCKIIKVFYQNVRGLRTKLDHFRNNLSIATSELYAITESGCNDSIFDAEIVPPAHDIVRCDRNDGRKQGGVLLVAKPTYELRKLELKNMIIDNEPFELGVGSVEVSLSDAPLVPVDGHHPPLAVSVRLHSARAAAPAPAPPPTSDFNSTDTPFYPKSFWKFVKAKRKSSNKLKIEKDGVVLSDKECVSEFAKYFHSVYSVSPPKLSVQECLSGADGGAAGGGGMESAARVHLEANLREASVEAALRALPPKTSVGPDGIPPFLARDCRSALAAPLCHIYNLCLEKSTFPVRWKITRVTPVPKGGGGTDVSYYRPLAVLSTFAKVFESVLFKSIYCEIQCHVSDEQHGFRSGRSTASNLLNFITTITPWVDQSIQVDAAYFDFRKAFDLVDNDVLLRKLANIGCTPKTLEFFASYLGDRKQYVQCGRNVSEPYCTYSGVSQGSNLGPLQFIITINDLPKVVKSSGCLLFSDDLKLFAPVTCDEDRKRFQMDIDGVLEWSKVNKLDFNVAKCNIISFSRSTNPAHHRYTLGGSPLSRVTSVRDLGVKMTSDLSFREHVGDICKKAYKILGFALRTASGFKSFAAIKTIFNSLVRSKLEFNAVVWSPYEAKYTLMLEKIQNKFLRFYYMKLYGVYPGYPALYPTLFVLGMVDYNRLEVRRDLTIVSYLFKLLRGRESNSVILQQLNLTVPRDYLRRRLNRTFDVPNGRTNLLRQAPLTRAIRLLNAIDSNIDIFYCSLSEFTKAALYIIGYKHV